MTYYKFLVDGNRSSYGDCDWQVGEWHAAVGELCACKNGFHASEKPLDAFNYVRGVAVAIVEVDGEVITEGNKICAQRMRATAIVPWTKIDSVELAIFAAELVLPIWLAAYPDDDRPAKAIEMAKQYSAAGAAAYAAADAAYAAAYAAADAHRAADAAARAAAGAAYAAAYAHRAADAAADAACGAGAAATDAINAWMRDRITAKLTEANV